MEITTTNETTMNELIENGEFDNVIRCKNMVICTEYISTPRTEGHQATVYKATKTYDRYNDGEIFGELPLKEIYKTPLNKVENYETEGEAMINAMWEII